MTHRAARCLQHLARRPLGARPGGPDSGITLLETIIGLFMLSVVTAAAVPLFIGVLQSTAGLGTKQSAITVASQQLELVRSLPPSSLITGRNPADVAALFNTLSAVNFSADVTASGNSDPTAAAGSAGATVPLTVTRTLNGVVYTARTFIDVCYLSKTVGTCTKLPVNGPAAYRVSVAVDWPKGPGVQCQAGLAGQCEYVATTLIDASGDPVFSTTSSPTITSVLNTSLSPAVVLTSLHPGQLITIQVLGTNFAYGANLFSGLGDVVSSVVNNLGTSLTATLQASPVIGPRTLVLANRNGASTSSPFTVSTSTPTITSLSPTTATRGVATRFTVTGTDFFATPTIAAPTTQPSLVFTGVGVNSSGSFTASPTTSGVTVVSTTSLTVQVTFPSKSLPYLATGTLTLTNPDGGTAAFAYSQTVA